MAAAKFQAKRQYKINQSRAQVNDGNEEEMRHREDGMKPTVRPSVDAAVHFLSGCRCCVRKICSY